MIDLSLAPILRDHHNCGESLTSLLVCNNGNLILSSTFTGVIFGLTRNEMIDQKLNPNYLLISRDTALKIEALRDECEKLEHKLTYERERYQELTSRVPVEENEQDSGVSALPYFAINDSFILQEGIHKKKIRVVAQGLPLRESYRTGTFFPKTFSKVRGI